MNSRGRRRGFSLLELLLVCAVLVLLALIVVPSMRGMYPYFKQQGAIDSVRAAWALARARAIEEGRPYRFSIEPNGGHFRVAPDQPDYWSGSPPVNDPEGPGLVLEKSLPSGVRFTLNGGPVSPATLDDPPIGGPLEEPRTRIPLDAYTTAAVFLPTGDAREDVRLVFQVKGTQPAALRLRGLTGTVTVEKLSF